MSDPDRMADVERGWSHGYDRKLSRFLARKLPARRVRLTGPSAVASITFDDIPSSAAVVGAPILERFGHPGTFYVATGLCGQDDTYWRMADRGQIRALAQAGHEIGCHTARHVNVQSLDADALARECDASQAMLADVCGAPARNFCYPYGDVGVVQKRVLAARFDTCRSIYEHPNAGRVDPALLGAYGLFDSVLDRRRLLAAVRRTVALRGWLIFYTHDVAADPTPMGATPALLAEVLTLLADHAVPVLTIADAARYHGLTGAVPTV